MASERRSPPVSTHTQSQPRPNTRVGTLRGNHPTSRNLSLSIADVLPTQRIRYASSVTYFDPGDVDGLPNHGTAQFLESQTGDEYDNFTRKPDYYSDFLDCAYGAQIIAHDSIFDLPDVRARFVDCTLTSGSFWHKETSTIAENVAEISSAVREVLEGVVAAGLLPASNERYVWIVA